MVPVELLHHRRRGHPPLRRCFHRDVLHPAVPLDGQLLLRVRVPHAGIHHPHRHLRGHRDGVLLLPAVRRGLQLVSVVRCWLHFFFSCLVFRGVRCASVIYQV